MQKPLSFQSALTLLFMFSAIGFIALAVAGAARTYSPVPFWDMWNGYLDFYVKATGGELGAWWAQHNEHRIVLARVLFWMDIAWFSGATRFLLVANYVLVGLSWLAFCKAWREAAGVKDAVVPLFLAAWLFSWSQEENLLWAFQSQFILAQLVPLIAFYCLHRAVSAPEPWVYERFALAIALGIASIGTMANGVLALPLMTLYALVVRWPWRRVALLGVLSCLCVGLYFHGYVAPGAHGSLGQALRDNPGGLVHYVLLYLGGPFFYFWPQGGPVARNVALLSGAFFVLSSVALAWRIVPRARENTLSLALLTFILYIGGSALGTAGGRLIFGVEQALSSRYMTPALMAWSALLIVGLSRFDATSLVRRHVWIFLLLILAAMLPRQWHALEVSAKRNVNQERWTGALALEMRVRDEAQIGQVFPDVTYVLALTQEPVERNLAVFGRAPLKDLGQTLDGAFPPVAPRACNGHLDTVQPVKGDARFIRVVGWFHDLERRVTPRAIRFVDARHTGVGAALTGHLRPDVAQVIDPGALRAGFNGYVRAETQHQTLTMVDAGSGCQVVVQVPPVLFQMSQATAALSSASVSLRQVQPAHQWQGTDYWKSAIDGMTVLGTRQPGDADTGALTVNLRRGDKLLYRSGPTSGRQFIEVVGLPNTRTSLPSALDWAQLEFSNPQLPPEFEVKFADLGTAWGEWSAIAVRSD